MKTHSFQFDMGGLMKLLAGHLYSSRDVFVRELLQNAHDAIVQRRQGGFGTGSDEIRFSLHGNLQGDDTITLSVEDEGIGLTEEEIHSFLSTIAESTKRERPGALYSEDLIGRFGVGLLSCFMVSREVVFITRSASTPEAPTLEWRGNADGSYQVRVASVSRSHPGTTVFLKANPEAIFYFDFDFLTRHLTQYARLLSLPIVLSEGERSTTVNRPAPPWHREDISPGEESASYLAYGEAAFGERFLAALPLRDSRAGIRGAAYLVRSDLSLLEGRKHLIHIRSMFVTESGDVLVPRWANFVRFILDCHGIRPTASRESLYQDDRLREASDAVEEMLKASLFEMAVSDPELMDEMASLHGKSLMRLACESEEAFAAIGGFLRLQTSEGLLPIREIIARSDGTVRHVTQKDEFLQFVTLERFFGNNDQGPIVNTGIEMHLQLLESIHRIAPQCRLLAISPRDLFVDTTGSEFAGTEEGQRFLDCATEALAEFQIAPVLVSLKTAELPAFFLPADGASARKHFGECNPHLAGPLLEISRLFEEMESEPDEPTDSTSGGGSRLILNDVHPLVRQLAMLACAEPEIARDCLRLLYVSTLLEARHPLSIRDREILANGISGMIESRLGNVGFDEEVDGERVRYRPEFTL